MGPNKITTKKNKKGATFDMEAFKLDIDELIQAFVKVIQTLKFSITTLIEFCTYLIRVLCV